MNIFKPAKRSFNKNGDLVLEKICTVTGEPYSLVIPYKNFMNYYGGGLIEEALKELSADDRQFYLTGMTPVELNELFVIEEDE